MRPGIKDEATTKVKDSPVDLDAAATPPQSPIFVALPLPSEIRLQVKADAKVLDSGKSTNTSVISEALVAEETAQVDGIANVNTPHIVALPLELQVQIFGLLDPVSSICLGPTSKVLYSIHQRLHGVVKLTEWFYGYAPYTSYAYGKWELRYVLEQWAGLKLQYSTSLNFLGYRESPRG